MAIKVDLTEISNCKICTLIQISLLIMCTIDVAIGSNSAPIVRERVFEWTVESKKQYIDAFNDVTVDAIFTRDGQAWRVPMFWRGGSRWTVRFAPKVSGEYTYRLESSDPENPDLNAGGKVTIVPYRGESVVLRRGVIQVSSNRRYFEHADGTPFFWLGDTWWTSLSSRLPWEGFQQLALDRKAKGFTVIQLCGGLIPSNEEVAPTDAGFCNEGGCVWDAAFEKINPIYFDYADRRIAYLLEQGLTPAIVGAWRQVLPQMGVEKLKKHWRYLIARYGAYPVFWVAGGEVYDPPPGLLHRNLVESVPGWTEVTRYIKETDPYHHPLSVHEIDPPLDNGIKDEKLTDFDLFQAGHHGWASIGTAIALLNKHYARTTITKPLVMGEIGYEKMAGHYEDFQRAAFWLSMLNGATGFTYGNISTAEIYSADKPFHRILLSPYAWDESMHFAGARQVAMGGNLLKTYPWWRIEPHPHWVNPAGTTLLEPNAQINGFDIDLIGASQGPSVSDNQLPRGEWKDRRGNWRLPYAAGIPRELRVIYLPYLKFSQRSPVPTIDGLEPGVTYEVFYWEPTLGIKYSVGRVGRTETGERILVPAERKDSKLYDTQGRYRGELSGPGWADYGQKQTIIGDIYSPPSPPAWGDWLLVMDAMVRKEAVTSN